MLYWSILDIIESLQADPRVAIDDIHHELKNELYFAVSKDPRCFMALLHGFRYPSLKRSEVTPFLRCVLAFVERRVPRNRSEGMRLLKQCLRNVSKLANVELVFLHDEEPGELVKDFSSQFMSALCTFKHATHVLDEETEIQRRLQDVEIRDGDRKLDYRFADSVEEIGIQASDIFAGLIGRHFTYVQDRTLAQLRAARARFTPEQHAVLALLSDLINRSDSFSTGLLHAVLPLDTQFKHNEFLFGVPAPAHLG